MQKPLNPIQEMFLDRWIAIDQRNLVLTAVCLVVNAIYLWAVNPFGDAANIAWPPYLAFMVLLPTIVPLAAVLAAGVVLWRGLNTDRLRLRLQRTAPAKQKLAVFAFVALAVGFVLLSVQIADTTHTIFIPALAWAGLGFAAAGWLWWRIGQLATLNQLADKI